MPWRSGIPPSVSPLTLTLIFLRWVPSWPKPLFIWRNEVQQMALTVGIRVYCAHMWPVICQPCHLTSKKQCTTLHFTQQHVAVLLCSKWHWGSSELTPALTIWMPFSMVLHIHRDLITLWFENLQLHTIGHKERSCGERHWKAVWSAALLDIVMSRLGLLMCS